MTKSRGIRNTDARAEAIASGATYYRSGIACRRGHVADRLTSNGSCVTCTAERKSAADKKHYAKHSAKLKAYQKNYRADNKEIVAERDRRKWLKNHDRNLKLLRVRSRKHNEKRTADRQFDAFMRRLADEEAAPC